MQIINKKLEIPKKFDGWLFNEWSNDSYSMCVSHYKNFIKVDIVYYAPEDLKPSPWYTLPIDIIYDPNEIIKQIIHNSSGLKFITLREEVNRIIGKTLANIHEIYRRTYRGELFYALTILEDLRQYLIRIDDWTYERASPSCPMAKCEGRITSELKDLIYSSYVEPDAQEILNCLENFKKYLYSTIILLKGKFNLSEKYFEILLEFTPNLNESSKYLLRQQD